MKKLIIVLVLSLIIGGFNFDKTQATTDHLVINEVYYDTEETKTEKREWIELFNPTGSDIDISGWKLTDLEKSFTFPAGTEIASKDYLIIARDILEFESYFTGNIADFEWSSMSLANTGDEVILRDDTNINIDVVTYENGSFAGIVAHPGVSTGHSIERQPKGKDSNNCAVDLIDQKSPTPGSGIPSATELFPASNITETSLELSWTKVADLDFERYEVYQATSETDLGKNNPISEKTDRDVVNFEVKNLTSGKKYYFVVRVVDENEGYSDSNVVSATTKIEYSKAIILNEILPKPKAGTDFEFIELYNNSDLVVDISSWKLDDLLSGGSSPYTIPQGTIINPQTYLVFYKTATKIALNDGGDNVYLLTPKNEIASATSYKKAGYDISWNWTGKKWTWSERVTAAAKNIIVKPIDPNAPIKTTIKKAKRLPKNTLVQVKGIVSVGPGPFGGRTIYIQRGGAGIQLYFYKRDWPNLKIGDLVRVTGKTSSVSGEKRIKIYKRNDIKIIGKGRIFALKLKTGEVGKYIGMLTQIEGSVVKTSGSTFYIDDGSGKIRIYIKKDTGIKLTKRKGDYLRIIGIVSKTKSGPRILPRFANDVYKLFSLFKGNSGYSSSEGGDSVLGEMYAIESAKMSGDYRSGEDIKIIKTKTGSQKTLVKAARGMIWAGTLLLSLLLLISRWFSKSDYLQ